MRDAELKEQINAIFEANYRVHGARKVWRELNRQGRAVARCTVERLMRELGVTGAVRGWRVITTLPGGRVRPGPGPRRPRLRRRRPEPLLGCGLHAGSQYTSFRLADHLEAAVIAASIGSVGDAYDNALMESTIGLFKTELIKPRRP
ncbi:transposase [Streptomyces hygroscopicus subsp. limoneus]|nr:transposase [Streptomyces hygroscopicus subsp. limoneus]